MTINAEDERDAPRALLLWPTLLYLVLWALAVRELAWVGLTLGALAATALALAAWQGSQGNADPGNAHDHTGGDEPCR